MDAKEILPLSVAIKDDNVIIIVKGDATMKISHILKKFVIDLMDGSDGHNRRFKIDLRHCTYMDSTFTGLLIILYKYAKDKNDTGFEIMDPSNFCIKVLDTMGLLSMFEISHGNPDYEVQSVSLKPFQIEKTEEAILMYLAHKELSEVSKDNEEEFENVQKYLKEHIEKETGKDIDNIDINDLTFLDKDIDNDDDIL